MSAPSLYRRHRPRTFAEVVGQEHVVRTLRNAVGQGKVHHAYLFVGSRGTGKTSMAKILAACLNCERGGPTVDPCGVCESCVSIAAATSLDVIEMDAASNNSVDDIRDLRERVAFAPVSGRHKVYILDEAHMLSPQAWNAFLKTLEEPPPNTIFVLATTEAQKVLPTVVDRCHRFDFQRPAVAQIAEVLRRAIDSEGIAIPPEAVALIARQATGSFRDALGTLEQLVTYAGAGGATIALEDVLAVLGVADAELLFAATGAIAERDPGGALRAAARVAGAGRDAGQFFRDLEAHTRALLVVQTIGEVPAELRLTDEIDARLLAEARRISPTDVIRLLDLIAAGLDALKNGAEPRTQLELVLLKGAAPEIDPGTRALLSRVERLEAVLADAPPTQPAPSPPMLGPQSPPPPVHAPAPESHAAAAPALATAQVAVAVAAPAAETAPSEALDLEAVARLWPAAVDALQADYGMLAAVLATARPVGLRDGELTIAFEEAATFAKKLAESTENRRAATDALRVVTGHAVRIAFELRALEEAGVDVQAAVPLTDDEWVARFVQEFDAEEIVPDQEGAD